MARRGRIIHAPPSAQPLVPTLAHLPGVAAPAWLDGINQRPAVRDAFGAAAPASDPQADAERLRQLQAAQLENERRVIAAEREQLAQLARNYVEAVAELAEHTRQEARPAGAAVVDLALLVARELIGREVKADPTLLAGAIEESLAKLDDQQQPTVRLSPSDLEVLTATRPDLMARASFLADARLAPSDCVLESAQTIIDRSLEQRLEAVRLALLQALAGTLPAEGEAE